MKFLLLILCVIPIIYAQCNGTGVKDCATCTAIDGCGWCSTTQQCLAGSDTNPSTGFCLGPAWQYGAGKCARCELLQGCRQCNMHPADCGWCDKNNNGCKPLSWFGQGLGACQKTVNCPCDDYSSCDSCLEGRSCQWCSNEGLCKSVDSTQGCNGPAFNVSVGCPCSYNQDCSSCKNAWNCQWCNNLGTCQTKGTVANVTAPCQVSTGLSCDAYCKNTGNTSCTSCTNLNGCAWCTADKTCVDSSFASCMIAHTCSDTCTKHNYCDPCLDNPSCMWCGGNTQKCQPKGDKCAMPSHTCLDVCTRLDACGACNDSPGCGWCPSGNEGAGKCLDVDKSKCSGMWAHSCQTSPIAPPQKCGFDGGSFVGGMFLVIGVIVVGGVAYLFYRWKTGRKILYTELR